MLQGLSRFLKVDFDCDALLDRQLHDAGSNRKVLQADTRAVKQRDFVI